MAVKQIQVASTQNGTYGNATPIGADAVNVDLSTGGNVDAAIQDLRANTVSFTTSQNKSESLKTQARTNIGAAALSDIANAVRYDIDQSARTSSEKTRARNNIGAASQGQLQTTNNNITSLQNNTVSFTDTQNKTSTEKAKARDNIGAIDISALNNVVKYDTDQSGMSSSLKAQARANIGAVSQGQLQTVQSIITSLENNTVSFSATQNKTDAEKAKARNNIGAVASSDIANVVRYDIDQSARTSSEKAQARINIGAVSQGQLQTVQSVITTLENNTVSFVTSQDKTDAEKAKARNNIGAASLSDLQSLSSTVDTAVNTTLNNLSGDFVKFNEPQNKNENLKAQARENIGAVSVEDSVSYTIQQNKSNESKAQARNNIGVLSQEEVNSLFNKSVRFDISQSKGNNEKTLARENIDAASIQQVEELQNIIKVQSTEPDEEVNKIWINPQETAGDISIATQNDFLNLRKNIVNKNFLVNQEYNTSDYVVYEDNFYKILEPHETGTSWSLTSKQSINIGDELKNIFNNFTNYFDKTKNYNIGDYVIYNGKIYECIVAGVGVWDSSHWSLKNIEELITEAMNYDKMQILSFSANKPLQVQKGSSVFNYTLSYSLNNTPVSLMINNQNITPLTKTGTKVINKTFTEDQTWTLTAVDKKGNIAEKELKLNFINRVYWGAKQAPSDISGIDDAFLYTLTRNLVNSKENIINLNVGSGRYVWYAVPSSFGKCVFQVNGIQGGFSLVKTFNHITLTGFSLDYDVYRSDYPNLGNNLKLEVL